MEFWIPLIAITFASVLEAIAHYSFQSIAWNVVPTSKTKSLDRDYHIAFAGMWLCVWISMLVGFGWKAAIWPVLYMIAARNTYFPWLINLFHSFFHKVHKPIWYLSDNGFDGWLKRIFTFKRNGEVIFNPEKLILFLRIVSLISVVVLWYVKGVGNV